MFHSFHAVQFRKRTLRLQISSLLLMYDSLPPLAPSAVLALTRSAQDTGSTAGGLLVYPAGVTHQRVSMVLRPQCSSFGTMESKLQSPRDSIPEKEEPKKMVDLI